MTAPTTALPTRRLLPGRSRELFFTLACLVFAASSRILDGGAWIHGAGSWFFAFGALLGVVSLIPGATYLELGPREFVACTLFVRWRVKWNDVERFTIGYLGQPRGVAFTYKEGVPVSRWGRRLARGLTGAESALPLQYGLEARELAGLLEEYRRSADELQPAT